MNSHEFTEWGGGVAVPSVFMRGTRSAVIVPEVRVSRLAFSSLFANSVKSGRLSSSPRFFSAPVHAKIVAIGFVEVCSPFLYL